MNRVASLDIVHGGILFLCMLASTFPPLSSSTTISLSLVGWFAFAFFQSPIQLLNSFSRNKIAIIFTILTIVLPQIFDASIIRNRYITLAFFPLGLVIFDYYHSKDRLVVIKSILLLSLPFFAYTFYKTITALNDSPYASRQVTGGNFDEATFGIGGYTFVYFLAILISILIPYLFNSKMKHKLFLGAICALCVFAIVKSNFFIAVLCVPVSLCITLLIMYRKMIPVFILLGFFVMVLSALGIDKMALDSLGTISKEGKLKDRIEFLKDNGIVFGIFEMFLEDRSGTLSSSWGTLIQNPLLGSVSDSTKNIEEYLNSDAVGQHSHFLDTFALMGVGVGILNIIVLFKPFFIPLGGDNGFVSVKYSCMAVLFIILFFNNGTPSIAFCSTIIYPWFISQNIDQRELNDYTPLVDSHE